LRAPAYATGATIIDLNQLLARHQVLLIRTAHAAIPEARRVNAGLTRGYAAQIAGLQASSGATNPLREIAF
jgi:hypothetical protein